MATMYTAKHPFQGNALQSQLSFPTGALITAKNGQEGQTWWWGNYNGTDGWFPPTYVSKAHSMQQQPPQMQQEFTQQKSMQQQPIQQQSMQQQSMQQQSMLQQQPMQYQSIQQQPMQQQTMQQSNQQQHTQQPSMQQRMQQISFPSSATVKQQQRNKPVSTNPNFVSNSTSLAMDLPNTNTMQINNIARNGSDAVISGFGNSNHDDPFAGLDMNPSPLSTTALNPIAVKKDMTLTPGTTTSFVTDPLSNDNSAFIGTSNFNTTTVNPELKAYVNPFGSNTDINILTHETEISSGPISRKNVENPFFAIDPSPPVKKEIPIQYPSSNLISKEALPSDLFSQHQEDPTKLTQDHRQKEIVNQQIAMKLAEEEKRKEIVKQEIAMKLAEEEKRIKREKEKLDQQNQLEWEKKVKIEREMRLQTASNSQGLGSSGLDLSAINSTASSSSKATIPFLHPKFGDRFFNPFEFLSESSKGEPQRKFNPIYRVQPFWCLLSLDTYVRRSPPPAEKSNVASKYDQLAKALSFVCHIVQENERIHGKKGSEAPLGYLKANQLGLEACIKLISILPHSAGASGKQLDTLFLTFIHTFVSLIVMLGEHQQITLPGGWHQPDGVGYVCLYIRRNFGNSKFSFTICNSGKDGLEYHPSNFDETTGVEQRQLAMTIWDIPASRIKDSTFWTVLFNLQVYPSRKNTAEFLYTKLLPSLNSRPLRSNLDLGMTEYHKVPDVISANNFHFLARLALTTTPVNGAHTSKYSSFLVMTAAVDLAYQTIADAAPSSMDPEDSRILKLSGRNLANYAASLDKNTIQEESLISSLSLTWDLLDNLLKKLEFTASKPLDQHSHGMSVASLQDSFATGTVNTLEALPESAIYPLFGRFRRDNYKNIVNEIMGAPKPNQILIPAVLTDETMPTVAIDFQTASSSLQRLCNACSLLLQQVDLVNNAPAFVASAAQYALTVTLPMPDLDPKLCFWQKTPMRRETQVNLLFLIRRMSRIYSAATACVQQSRGLIAIRTTAFACAACIADAICRVEAVDDPSPFSLHYSGKSEGPTQPFGIQAGSFETLAANMPIFDPE